MDMTNKITDNEKNRKGSVYRALLSAISSETNYEDFSFRIEKIIVKEKYIEYRVWSPRSISYNNKVISCGRWCSSKCVSTPDGMTLVANEKRYILKGRKVESEESYTEDIEFYSKCAGIDVSPLLNMDSDKFYRCIENKNVV